MTKYFPGDKIGPYEILFIERLPKSRGIFKCSFCGELFESKISHIVNGGTKSCGCQHFVRKYKNGDILGPYNILLLERFEDKKYSYKGKFKCPYCEKIFTASIDSVVRGATQSCGCIKTLDITGVRFDRLVALEATNKRTSSGIVWKCICNCGNICYVSLNHLRRNHVHSCGQCNFKSVGEEKIFKFLKGKNIIFETQKRFKDCRDKKPLPFDFYLPEYNCCIEYDGLGHYESSLNSEWRNENNVRKTQYHDTIKTKYCLENNINLIRIPYTEYNKIEDILEKNLLKIFSDK